MSDPTPAPWIRPLLGRADDMRAEVWLRCGPDAAGANTDDRPIVVSGTLVGPECSTATTLPTTIPLVDQGSVEGRPALARGVCTEPGFWTPELPNLYRADVTLRRGDEIVAVGRRLIGLRRLGVKGRSFSLDGRRYVPRGVPHRADAAGLGEVRECAAVAIVEFPGRADPLAGPSVASLEAMLTMADRIGVAVVIRFTPSNGAPIEPGILGERLEAWSAHPSAFLVIVPSESADAAVAAVRRRGTMLLGLEVDGLEAPPSPPETRFDTIVVRLPEGGVPHAAWQQTPACPLVAAIGGMDRSQPAVARAACDRLQAALAAWASPELRERPWDWAGYLVT